MDKNHTKTKKFDKKHRVLILSTIFTGLLSFYITNSYSEEIEEFLFLNDLIKRDMKSEQKIVENNFDLKKIEYDNKLKSYEMIEPKERLVKWETKEIIIKSGDSINSLINVNKISNQERLSIIEEIKSKNPNLLNLKIGNKIQIDKRNGNFFSIKIFEDEINYFRVVKDENDVYSYKDILPTTKEVRLTKGKLSSSLYSDAKKAGLSAEMVSQLTSVFAWDIDFSKDISKGDEFRVLYDVNMNGDEIVTYGDIIAAYFKTRSGEYYAFKFKDNDREAYFNNDGESVEKAFIRSPVKLPRITSNFTTKRFHPILKVNRAHKGVDYGGVKNTKIMAVGDGKVKIAGWHGAYGKAVVIDHGLGYETLYGHLNKIDPSIKKGSTVKQMQVIGYMGKTGMATGVHLHYEFKINGRHYDPLKVNLPEGNAVKDKNGFEDMKKKTIPLLME